MTERTRTREPALPTQPSKEVMDLDAAPTGAAGAPAPHGGEVGERLPDRLLPDRILLPGVSGTYIRRPWLLDPTPAGLADLEPEAEFTPHPDGGPIGPVAPLPGRLPVAPIDRLPIERVPLPPIDIVRNNEDLRVDVDGWYPQNVVSGTITRGLARRVDWYAPVSRTAAGTYLGAIAYRNGDATLLPHTTVEVALVRRRPFGGGGSATATFSGGGARTSARTFTFSTSTFHPVEFEYDTTSDSDAVTDFDIASHPNRPSGLAVESVNIETVFSRAGFKVTKSGGDGAIPVSTAGGDAKWTEQELNDAMSVYWSAYSTAPAWAAWALFAGQSIDGPNLGGIMFDYTGSSAPQRQGCVVFSDSFISNAPSGDANAAAYVQRMRFWTAVHELGHAFNLAHAWNKNTATWIPTSNEDHLRSFMNYPHRFTGGANAFFSDFRYRFSDSELLFMRHAPERFVRMGDAAWFTDHGFSQAETIPGAPLLLHLRAHRSTLRYEFLEPVTLELKLENTGGEPIVVDAGALDAAHCTIVVQRRGQDARQLLPFATRCLKPQPAVLEPGASMYASVTVSSGRDGWILCEPGDHTVQVAVHLADEDIVSTPLSVRVLPPAGREEELVAQDVLTPEVGRVLAAGGTRRDSAEAAALHTAAERLPGSAIAAHSRMALGKALIHSGKTLVVTADSAGRPQARKVTALGADPEAAVTEMAPVLDDIDQVADTFGHIAARKRVTAYSQALADSGRQDEAAQVQRDLHGVMAARGVLPTVLDQIAASAAGHQGRR